MASDDVNFRTRANDQQKPTPENQNVYTPSRASRYGELFVQPLPNAYHALANEGSYWYAHNAINDAATTLAGHAAPVLADADSTMTKPLVFIRVPTGATKRVFLHFIELDVVTAPTGATTDNWAAQLDSGPTRWSSGGSALTFANPNMQNADASILNATNALLAGAVVVGAETANVRDLGFGQIRSGIPIIGDRYVFRFGGDVDAVGSVVATAASRHVIQLPPVVLGAQDQFLLAHYGPSWSAAAIYKLRMGWVER
jgi:hypothetical protein